MKARSTGVGPAIVGEEVACKWRVPPLAVAGASVAAAVVVGGAAVVSVGAAAAGAPLPLQLS